MQDDIAQSVVRELRAALLGERIDAAASARVEAEVEIATKGRAENPEAYRLYLQGRFELEHQTREGIERSIELVRQALALDPAFARGWAGLSRSYNFLAGFGWTLVGEGFEMARHPHSARSSLRPISWRVTWRWGTCSRASTGTGPRPTRNSGVRWPSPPTIRTYCAHLPIMQQRWVGMTKRSNSDAARLRSTHSRSWHGGSMGVPAPLRAD